MKKIIAVSIIVFVSSFMVIHSQQRQMMKDSANMHKGMMKGEHNMMGGDKMMNMGGMKMCPGCGRMMKHDGNIMAKYIMCVKMLPDMQDHFSLSDDQVNKLIDLQSIYIKRKADLKANLSKNQLKLKGLLKRNAPSKEVGDQLKINAGIMTDIATAGYETYLSMRGVLDQNQQKQLDDMLNHHFNTDMDEEDDE